MEKAKVYSEVDLAGTKGQRTFKEEDLTQIALPLGGLGAGSINLNGHGGLQDFSIRNKPSSSSLPDGQAPTDAAFGIIHVKGKHTVTKLLEGPLPVNKIYANGMKSQGFREGGFEGLPRFKECSFLGEYPFGYVAMKDPEVPVVVALRAYNPFIPNDDRNSGIPCAILEYTFRNTSAQKVEFDFSYHLSHLAPGVTGEKSKNESIENIGIYFHNSEPSGDEHFGNASLIALDHKPLIKAMWFRGGWSDSISSLWREISTGEFSTNKGSSAAEKEGRNGGSILIKVSLNPQEKQTIPIAISWYFPNCYYDAETVHEVKADLEKGKGQQEKAKSQPKWKPWYTTQWTDAKDVILYLKKNYSVLKDRTQKFHDSLFGSSWPSYVLDAVSANLAILKSPTLLRQDSGNVWAWEGCAPSNGCGGGSSTPVFSYAQSLAHLFPSLERTLREQELHRSMDEKGHVTFRASLPDGTAKHTNLAAADGQLAGIMKVYRDWQISGDDKWLKKMYPALKKSINYCIECWDPKHKGILEEPHHNTYDIEFWGPDSMCSSIYLGALTAFSVISAFLGNKVDAKKYNELAVRGAKYLDKNLFNGEYFYQKVDYKGLKTKEFINKVESIKKKGDNATEQEKLLLREGPKYQYGEGCLSDGVIGAWMAMLYGIATPQTNEGIKKHLQSVFNTNFRASLWSHVNTQRPGYAIGNEAGLLLCSWPKGDKPTLPFPYSDEVFTGIEYQVASHLISVGLINEGLTIVKALRDRYNGRVRNPWNEYERGDHSVRAMASYSLLQALSGFRYSRVESRLYLEPKMSATSFSTFFSCSSGYGSISVKNGKLVVSVVEGSLILKEIHLTLNKKIKIFKLSEIINAGKSFEVVLTK